jgi:hypothetical protein
MTFKTCRGQEDGRHPVARQGSGQFALHGSAHARPASFSRVWPSQPTSTRGTAMLNATPAIAGQSSALAGVLELLARHGCAPRRAGAHWAARCPAHADRNPSLSVAEGADGRVLLRCWAGCETSEILRALGLSWSDVFSDGARHDAPRVCRAPKLPLARPPLDEVLALWSACVPVIEDAQCEAWFCSRHIDPDWTADRDLARALPFNARVEPWARLRGPWPREGYRIALPLFDAKGEMRSLHARSLDPAAKPKAALPAKFSASGLLLADAAARLMLRTGELWGELWITEGAPDFLTAATTWGDAADPAPAVLGILSGSWTEDVAARVPSGARVIIAVHEDEAGEKYKSHIAKSLEGRVQLKRWTARTVGYPS